MKNHLSRLVLTVGLLLASTTIFANESSFPPPPPPPPVAAVASPNPIPTSICNGDSIQFIADNSQGNLTIFGWNFNGAAAGPQTLFGQNVTFIAGNPGSYTFDLIVGDGTLLDTFSFNMVVNACTPPTINISGTPSTLCEGSQVAFTDASTPGSTPIVSRSWSFPGGTPATSTSTTPFVTYNTAGTYDVFYEVTDGNGTYKDTLIAYINVIDCPIPVADFFSNKQQICPGECVNFTDQSQHVIPGQSNWSWSFPGSDSTTSIQQHPQNICYQIPGVYDVTLTVTNANGTDVETKIGYITVDSCLPPEFGYASEKMEICQGTCVQFFNRSSRDTVIQWQFFGADAAYEFSSEEDPIVCYSNVGQYAFQAVVNNEYGPPDIFLSSSREDSITVLPFPKVVAPPDTSVLIGNSVILQAYGEGQGFNWTPQDGVECPFCARTRVAPIENTKYFVTNFNEHGCSRTDSVNVVVIDNYYRGVPDIFSPNGDGENDELQVYGNGFATMEFYVYDRSGNIVFESRDQNVGWDGTYKGEPMEIGVYVYFVKITYISGFQEILKGDVTLVR